MLDDTATRARASRALGIVPARMSATIRAGSSVRGLSSVRTMSSASSAAIRPMSGRFPASRSPPQPNTTRSCPRQCNRAAPKAFGKCIRRVRVIHDRQRRQTAPTKHLHPAARGPALLERPHGLRQRNVPGEQHSQHRQHVIDVELTNEPHGELAGTPTGVHADHETRRIGHGATGAHILGLAEGAVGGDFFLRSDDQAGG